MPLPVISNGASKTPVRSEEVQPSAEVESRYKTHRRFDRAARLFSENGLHQLMGARVLIFGMGGVGSFAAEALARSAVGHLVLVDFDDVCVTNTNRQLHAMKGNIGRPKAEIMAERCKAISPTSTVEPILEFYNAASSERLLEGRVDFVVDAIDNMTAKAHLLATCVTRGIPVVSSMGAAAKLDPTRVRVADLGDTEVCPLARELRSILRKVHGMKVERGMGTGILAVFSDENPIDPQPVSYDEGKGFVCVCPNKDNGLYSCEHRNRIDGSASFVTGTFGLVAASAVVRRLIAQS